MKYHQAKAPLLQQEKIAENTYALTLRDYSIAQAAQPGQFAHLRITSQLDPFLRRPLSISDVNQERGELTFWYQTVGKGTTLLSEATVGDTLDLIGPLGRGFQTDLQGKRIGLVAGGIGIAPLIFLGKVLSLKNTVQFFWGGQSKAQLPSFPLDLPLEMITEDGSSTRKGLVTELLSEQFDFLFACGPQPMLSVVAHWAFQKKMPLQVSLEAVMACGVGACSGCIIRGREKQFKVCQDGPVFWAEEIFAEQGGV